MTPSAINITGLKQSPKDPEQSAPVIYSVRETEEFLLPATYG